MYPELVRSGYVVIGPICLVPLPCAERPQSDPPPSGVWWTVQIAATSSIAAKQVKQSNLHPSAYRPRRIGATAHESLTPIFTQRIDPNFRRSRSGGGGRPTRERRPGGGRLGATPVSRYAGPGAR